MGGEADRETVQWTVSPPNALRHAQGREIARCLVEGTGREDCRPSSLKCLRTVEFTKVISMIPNQFRALDGLKL